MKIPRKLLGIAMAACMVLTMLPTAAFAYTGGNFENGDMFALRSTAKLSGNTTVSDYTVGSTSVLWADNDSTQATFNAWYPTYGNLDSDITVKALNVSISAKPDLMMAAPVTSTRTGGVTLQFKHVMHRLVVNLSKDDSVSGNLNDATIALKGMNGSASINFTNGTVVGSYPGEAYPGRANGAAIIIAPQTLVADTDWIEVTIGTDYAQTFKVPTGLTNFESGEQTILNLQLQSDHIVFLSQTVGPWDANGDGSEDVSTITLDIASVPALTAPTNPGWANSTPGIAKWDAVANASGYTVQLFKDALLVDTGFDAGTATEYNFASKIAETGNGDYIFNVQARGNGTTLPDSGWSDYSAKYVYSVDNTSPVLSNGSAFRMNATIGSLSFTSNEAGRAYYKITDKDAAAPTKGDIVSGGIDAGSVTNTAATIQMTWTADAKDIYVVVKDAAGNISEPLKIELAAYVDTIPPLLSSGSVKRTSDTAATISFTTDDTGMAYYSVVDKDATAPEKEVVAAGTSLDSVSGTVADKSITLTAGAKDIYVVVKDAAGNISNPLKIVAEDYVSPAETLANTLTLAGFTAAVSGSTVTITGTKIATDRLSLKIPTGVKVLWNASLTGAINDPLVLLDGAGTFELAGGEITNTGSGGALYSWDTSLVISGGTASSSSNVATVMTYNMGSNPMTLTMTGGTVTSTSINESSSAISAGGNTVITGGTITAKGGNQVFLNNAVVVYRSGLLTAIASKSLSASIAVAPSKTYATPTETDGLTATGYSVLAGHVTAKWAVLYSGEGTGVWVDYTYNGTGSGSWRVSYPAVQVVSGRHLLSYRANGGTGATPVSTVYYGQSYTVSANVFTRTNYTFTGWNTEADGKGTPYAVGATLIGGSGSDDILLYAQWSPTGGGSNPTGGGGGGGVSTPTTTAPTASGATATTTVTAQTGTNGTASASVTQTQVTSAIEKAQAAAKSSGEAPSVEIHVSGGSNATAVQTTIPKAAVQAMVSGKMDSLTLSGPVAAMTFDAQAISAIAGAASGDVAFASSKVDNSSLSNAARQTVGNHPVYNFSVTSGGSTISQFGGAVTVSVPYAPAAGENPDAIVAYYINANGEPELMHNCHYDAQTGTLVFTTTHFSTYAVGYHKVAFSDVAEDAWCYDAVTFLAARGITGGTTETAFNPNATLTRGQFITLVMRAYGIEPDESAADNFSDAGDTYYTGYLAAAKRLGISNGVGGNKFAPKQAVSRQQMFTLLYNALKAIDQLPEGASGKTLSDFTDSANIASYAQEAMESLVKSGAVSGSNGNLRPTATTTRAQMAQVLYNLLAK